MIDRREGYLEKQGQTELGSGIIEETVIGV